MAKRAISKNMIFPRSTTVILAISLVITSLVVCAQDSDWLMYRYDDTRKGNSPLTSNIVEPAVKWKFQCGDWVKSPPTVGDINQDGEYEVVFGSNDGHLYALDRFGNEIWNFTTLGPVVNSPSIGDVDGDDGVEIVFGGFYAGTDDPNLYVLNGEDGSLIWQFESANIGGFLRGFQASPLLHDINDDGINDVLIGSLDHFFYAFDGPTGAIIWQSTVFDHYIRASSPLGDVDMDGELEVIVVDNHANVRMYEARTGTLEWAADFGHGVEATPALADVDGDGFDEIICFGVGEGNITGDAVVFNHDGTELWRSSVHTYFYTSPAILDMDGDGLPDIIGGDSNDHTIIAYKGSDGTILWETVLAGSVWSQAPLVTADIDSDGIIEVMAGANPNLYCLNGNDGSIQWTFGTSNHIWGQPTVADLEQDGLAEVLFGCYDNYLYVLENLYNPPVADAGEDKEVEEGDEVLFDGTGSSDPNDDIAVYTWDFDSDVDSDGDNDTANDIDAIGPNPSHIYGDNGVFSVTLTVTDERNLTDTDTCTVTVLNVDPKVKIVSAAMEVEIGLRVAGRKFNDVGLTLYEDGDPAGYISIERMPGSPDEQVTEIPIILDLTKSYSATITYTPEDPPNIGANPVWITIKTKDGSKKRFHHTFNVQQSKKRDSDHHNHVEPWEVDLNLQIMGLPFEVTAHVIDPGSDDETITFEYGTQILNITYLNQPPDPDPFPSPQVNPRDIVVTTPITYEGPGTLELTACDDDGGSTSTTLMLQ